MKVGASCSLCLPQGEKITLRSLEKNQSQNKTERLAQTGIATGDGFKNRNTCLRIVTGNEISEMPQPWGYGGQGQWPLPCVSPALGGRPPGKVVPTQAGQQQTQPGWSRGDSQLQEGNRVLEGRGRVALRPPDQPALGAWAAPSRLS